MSALTVLRGLDPLAYSAHSLHAPQRIWVDKNCYADLWIELLHVQGLEPMACLPFVLAIDFEGDQWTFFKPPHAELRDLYGVDVQELTVWRPLLDHCTEHLAAGKLVSTEADAFWLPDTAGTDYRAQHTKTTIVVNELDVQAQRMGYFHNAGYFMLEGEDFAGLFAAGHSPSPEYLPLFAELVRIDRVHKLADADLRRISTEFLGRHLAWRPVSNPVVRFGKRFEAELPLLQRAGLGTYHRWAFATVRQLGAAFELAALYLTWLEQGAAAHPSIAHFERIALNCKTLILKAARAVNSGRALDAAALFDEMAGDWERGMAALA